MDKSEEVRVVEKGEGGMTVDKGEGERGAKSATTTTTHTHTPTPAACQLCLWSQKHITTDGAAYASICWVSRCLVNLPAMVF